jgi:hypothetical protein
MERLVNRFIDHFPTFFFRRPPNDRVFAPDVERAIAALPFNNLRNYVRERHPRNVQEIDDILGYTTQWTNNEFVGNMIGRPITPNEWQQYLFRLGGYGAMIAWRYPELPMDVSRLLPLMFPNDMDRANIANIPYHPPRPVSPETRARFDPVGYIEAKLDRLLDRSERLEAIEIFNRSGGSNLMILEPYIQYLYDAPNDFAERVYNYGRNRIGRPLSPAEDQALRQSRNIRDMDILVNRFIDRLPTVLFRRPPNDRVFTPDVERAIAALPFQNLRNYIRERHPRNVQDISDILDDAQWNDPGFLGNMIGRPIAPWSDDWHRYRSQLPRNNGIVTTAWRDMATILPRMFGNDMT